MYEHKHITHTAHVQKEISEEISMSSKPEVVIETLFSSPQSELSQIII